MHRIGGADRASRLRVPSMIVVNDASAGSVRSWAPCSRSSPRKSKRRIGFLGRSRD
jgi:hypothetical protein